MPAVSLVCPHCEKPVEVQVTGVTRSRPCPVCGEMLMLQVAEKNKKAKRRALLMGGAVPEAAAETTLQIPSRKPVAADSKPVPADPKLAVASAKIENTDAPPPPAAKITSAPNAQESPSEPAKAPKAAAEPEEQRPPTGSHARTLNFVPSHEPQVLPGDAFERMRMDPEIKEFRKRLIIGASVVVGCIVLALVIRAVTSGDSTPAERSIAAETFEPVMIEEEPEPAPVPDGSLVFKASGKQDFAKATTAAAPPGAASSQLTMDMALSVEALRKFLAAPNWKERLAWSRPASNLEERMAAFYTKNADGPVPHENIVESKETTGNFVEHTVIMEGGARRVALVEKTPKGPRVDWAAFVGAGEMGWSQFMEERPVLPVAMRVMVSDGFYYENQFGSPRLLKCLELRCVSEPGTPVILGYIERDNTIAQQIEFWLKQSNGAALPLILKLKYPSNAPSPKQVWVSEIVSQGWQDS
jgi:hypothetical protein